MKYLREGLIATQELATWFDESYSTFRKHSTERYETLKQYCKYTKIHGYINVEVIYQGLYIKEPTQYQLVKKYTQRYWIPETAETAARVAHLIKRYCPDVIIVEDTCADYVVRAKNELWPEGGSGQGERGGSYREWVKAFKHDDDRVYVGLTEEERQIKSQIRAKYYPILSEDERDIYYSDYLEGKISQQEYISKINGGKIKKSDFYKYMKEVATALECDYITKATYVKDGVYYVTEIDSSGIPHRVEVLIVQPKRGAF